MAAKASIAKILHDADELFERSKCYLGLDLKGEDFDRFYSHIGTCLQVPYEGAQASLRYLMGQKLTKEHLTDLCIRLIANHEVLRTKPMPPWRGQARDEWSLAIITAARLSYRDNNEKGGFFKLSIISGTAAGTPTTVYWSSRYCQVIASKLGFPRRRGERVTPVAFRHPRDMVRLRLVIQLTAGSTDMPKFKDVKVTSTLRSFNIKLLKRRFRMTDKCPRGYDDSFPCHNCPHGIALCELATHRLDFKEKVCVQCKQSSMFDPDFSDRVCIDCLEKASGKATQEKSATV